MSDQRPSDAEPESAVEPDGSLAPTSTADGSGTSNPVDEPVAERLRPDTVQDEEPNDRLIEGNRVTTKEDME
jgi:hypothetical protein